MRFILYTGASGYERKTLWKGSADSGSRTAFVESSADIMSS